MYATIDIVSLGLAGLLAMVVAGNNLSACAGPLIGSGMVNRRTGTLIAILGYIIGLAVEGPKLSKVTQVFLPMKTPNEVFSILLVSFLIFLTGEIFKIPLSLSKALTGAVLGVAVQIGLPISNNFLVVIISFWILAPIAATALGILLVEMDQRISPKNLWRKLTILKTGLLIVSFISAYVLGSNTLGLIAGIPVNFTLYASVIVGVASILGAWFLGKGALHRLAEGFYNLRYPNAFFAQLLGAATVELATQVAVPLSITETVSSSIIGSGLASKMRMMNGRNVFLVISSWIFSPVAGFLLAYALSTMLH